MIAPAFKNRIQIQAGDAHVCKIIQLFPDALQSTAEEIEIKDLSRSRVFDVAGQIIPVSVQQRVGFASEPGQRHISPVEPVRKNLVHHSLFHPVRRDSAPVIHRNLIRGRLLFVLLPPAAQLCGVIAVVICFFFYFYNKVIPEQAAGFRHGNPADVTALLLYCFTGQRTGSFRRFCFFLQRLFCCVFSQRNVFIRQFFFFLFLLLTFPFFLLHGNQRFPGALLP